MKIKLQTIAVIAMLWLQLPTLKAQSLLFHEDFEISPVTNIFNSGETQLTEGPSPCGKGSRGNTADFNSTNVDFQNLQNSSYFLGVNPESPCGGFYTASLTTDSLDLSAADSLKFKCHYFKSTTLGWGGAILNIVFNNGTTNFTIDQSKFPINDNWDSLEIALPNSMIDPSVLMTINLGGGEGVGIDDIKIINVITTNINKHNLINNVKLYPVPASNLLHIELGDTHPNINYTIMDLYGNVIAKESIQQTSNALINVEHLSKGIYIIKITDNTNKSAYYKIVKN